MTGLVFTEHWPDAGEWWRVHHRWGAVVGFFFNGEGEWEETRFELGDRVSERMQAENPPYPGWYPG